MNQPQYAVVLDICNDFNPITDSDDNVCVFTVPVDLRKVAAIINSVYGRLADLQIELVPENNESNTLCVKYPGIDCKPDSASYVIQPCVIIP